MGAKIPFLSQASLISKNLNSKRTIYWAHKGAFALADQAFFAGSSFLLNLLLARWLAPAKYGHFVLAFSTFLLLSAANRALIIEPMMVYGSGPHFDHFFSYFKSVLQTYVVFSLLISIVTVGISTALEYFQVGSVGRTVLWMSICAPMIILLQIVRNAFYVQLRTYIAALSSFSYIVLLLSIVYLAQVTGHLNERNIFFIMGITSLTVSLAFIKLLARLSDKSEQACSMSHTMMDHWGYGRWALGTQAVVWLSGNFYYVVLPLWIGMEGVAALKALLNIISPAVQIVAAVTGLYIPILSRRLYKSFSSMTSLVKKLLGVSFIATIIHLILLSLFNEQVLQILYAQKYTRFSTYVPLVAFLPVMSGLIAVLGSVLRVIKRPDKIFQSYVISATMGILVGLPLSASLGLVGALIGMLLSYTTTTATMFLHFRRANELLGQSA